MGFTVEMVLYRCPFITTNQTYSSSSLGEVLARVRRQLQIEEKFNVALFVNSNFNDTRCHLYILLLWGVISSGFSNGKLKF